MKGERTMKRALIVMVLVGVAAMLTTGCSQKKDDTLQPVEVGKAPAIEETLPPTVETMPPPPPTMVTTPPKTKAVEKATPTTKADSKKAETKKVDTTKEQKYTVKSGDSLSSIAKHFYGEEKLWTKIADANKSKIKDKDKINVGAVLVIPAK